MATLPVVDAVRDDHGRVRCGILATLVDAIGGGLAAYAAAPGWIATADLDLQLTGAPTEAGVVDAVGRVLRAGRSTVVISVDLSAGGSALGLATMTFAVLPRRDSNPVMPVDRARGPQSFLDGAGRRGFPRAGARRVRYRDGRRGARRGRAGPSPYVENSLGAVQGGVVATIVERRPSSRCRMRRARRSRRSASSSPISRSPAKARSARRSMCWA